MEKKFEAWELTAFALGELSSERAAVLKDAVEQDPALAEDLAEIRETIATISSAYPIDSDCGLSESQQQSVVAAISNAPKAVTIAKTSGGWSRSQILGWAATAACLLVVVSLSGWAAFWSGHDTTAYKSVIAQSNGVESKVSLSEVELRADDLISEPQPDSERVFSVEGTSSPRSGTDILAADGGVQTFAGRGFAPKPENTSGGKDNSEGLAEQLSSDPALSRLAKSGASSPSFEANQPQASPITAPTSLGDSGSQTAGASKSEAKENSTYGGISLYKSSGDSPSERFKPGMSGGGNSGGRPGLGGGGGYGGTAGAGYGSSNGQGLPELGLPSLKSKGDVDQHAGSGGDAGPDPWDTVREGHSPIDDRNPISLSKESWDELSRTRNVQRDGEIVAEFSVAESKPIATIDGKTRSYSREVEVEESIRLRELAGVSEKASGDRFASIVDNPFRSARQEPLSTFSIDVDTASYSKLRQYVMELSQLPPAASVRIEELLNYFHYDYAGPNDDQPFASSLAVARCPWNAGHRLVRVALQAKKIELEKRPLSNLVFLLDVSGSMNEPNKLPLVQQSMRMMISNLGENDRVAMVVYAGAAGMVLDSTLGSDQSRIMSAVDRLTAGGSTNGGQGIQLAYQIAREHFITGGANRVILCTDGDFNVGVTGTDELVKLVEENAKTKIFLTVLGFGMGNTNDEMLEKISDRGNGVYGFIDNEMEARKLMIEQLTGSLVTVAKDVKIQVEFNPAKVQGYRLIGYENRVLATEDFNNDKKDAGDIGAGHCVTALYEIIPAGDKAEEIASNEDGLRYQSNKELKDDATNSNELMIVKMRFKQPDGTTSVLQEFPLVDKDQTIQECDRDFRWAASIAQFGMLLRNSPYRGQSNWDALIESVQEAAGEKPDAYRQEALELIKRAAALSKG